MFGNVKGGGCEALWASHGVLKASRVLFKFFKEEKQHRNFLVLLSLVSCLSIHMGLCLEMK